MRGMDIFCASQASTSICLSTTTHHTIDMDTDTDTDLPSRPSSSSAQLGGRAIDRHNPIIRDSRRLSFRATTLSAPCSSSHLPPINPTPYHQLNKSKTNPVDPPSKPPAAKKPSSNNKKKSSKKSSSSVVDGKQSGYDPPHHAASLNVRKSAATLTDFITPPGSSRYLLGEPGSLDGILEYNGPNLGLVPVPLSKQQREKDDKSSGLAAPSKLSSSSRFNKSSAPDDHQVVVLRVSLHCKGCEGKLRKHLSRMEGVTSFNIDFAAKKVTVAGDVTPLSVLASVSRVKNAQFWTPPSVVGPVTSDHNNLK